MNRTRIAAAFAIFGLLILNPSDDAARLLGNPKVDYGSAPVTVESAPAPTAVATLVDGPLVAEPADPPTPVVKIKVSVPACSAPGQAIEYRIRVENCSAADAHHVVVKNPLPANAKLVRASPEPHEKTPELVWKLGTMNAGAGCDITLILQPTDKEDVKNCTRVTFEHGQCVTTRQLAAHQPGEGPPDKEPPVMPPADEARLSLVIDGPKKQYANLDTRYFVTVKNIGQASATNLAVEFMPTAKMAFVSASDEGKFLAGKVAWLLGTLEAGASRTLVTTLKPKEAGEQCHEASALADKGVKAQAKFCTLFGGLSALLIELRDRFDPIEIGTETSYQITIINPGNAPLTNIRVRAFIPDGLALTKAGPADNKLDEPVQGAKVLAYDVLPSLPEGERRTFEVFVQGVKPGDYRFRVQIIADQLEAGPVIEEESTRVYNQDGAVKGKLLNRAKAPSAK